MAVISADGVMAVIRIFSPVFCAAGGGTAADFHFCTAEGKGIILASFVIVLPAPMIALSPTLTGATSAVFEPIKASAPMTVCACCSRHNCR